MPRKGWRVISVKEETYRKIRLLVDLGLEEKTHSAVENAVNEYVKNCEDLIREMSLLKERWIERHRKGGLGFEARR